MRQRNGHVAGDRSAEHRHRVLIFSHSGQLAGAERALLVIVRELVQAGLHVHVVVPPRGPLGRLLRNEGAVVHHCPMPPWLARRMQWPVFAGRIFGTLMVVPWLFVLILAVRPCVSYTNSLVIPEGALAARWSRVPHVWHVREYVEGNETLRTKLPMKLVWALVGRWSSQIFAVSGDVARQIPRSTAVEIVHAGIDSKRFSGAPAEAHRWLRDGCPAIAVVGRQSAAKGSFLAVDVARVLRESCPGMRMLLVGPAARDVRDLLEARIGEYGLGDAVGVEDFVDDVRTVFAAADVALVPSRHEAYGLVTLEALQAGLPVVGTCTGGTKDLLSAGGGLTAAFHDPGQFAAHVLAICSDPGLADWCRRTGAEIVAALDPAAEAEALIRFAGHACRPD